MVIVGLPCSYLLYKSQNQCVSPIQRSYLKVKSLHVVCYDETIARCVGNAQSII